MEWVSRSAAKSFVNGMKADSGSFPDHLFLFFRSQAGTQVVIMSINSPERQTYHDMVAWTEMLPDDV